MVALLAFLGVVVLNLFPAKAYLEQQRREAGLTAAVAEIDATNVALRARVHQLRTDDAEIERLARERYLMVLPGEEGYSILPSGTPPTTVPPPPEPDRPGWWSRLWHSVTSALP